MTEKNKTRRFAKLGQLPLVQGFEFLMSRTPSSATRSTDTTPRTHHMVQDVATMLQTDYRELVDAPVPPHLTRLVELLEQRETVQPSPRIAREDEKT